MCLIVSPACMYVHCVCGWYPERREDPIRYCRRGIAESCMVPQWLLATWHWSGKLLTSDSISHS